MTSPHVDFRNWEMLQEKKEIRAGVEYNTFEFYSNGTDTLGFYYELLNTFAQQYQLTVSYVPLMSFNDRVDSLLAGKIDIIASSIPTTLIMQQKMRLTTPIIKSKQVLVQRKTKQENDSTFIDNSLKLANETIYVTQNSPAKLRLRNLSNEIGDTIYIKEITKYGPEQLMSMVSHQDIDYSICDEIIARNHLDNMPNLDITQHIGFLQYYAFGVQHKAQKLVEKFDQWFTKYQYTRAFKKLQRKYKIK
jgi:ABC-type amino acid transport substrate-binding protein